MYTTRLLHPRLIGLLVVFSLLLVSWGSTRAQELTRVVWGVDSFLTTLPQRIAQERGYYREEGVQIELQVSALGIDSMDAIIAGSADLGNGAHWALTIRLGRPNIGLGGFILGWYPPVEFLAAPGIETLEDLRGKRIATITGSLWDWYIQQALNTAGLTREDVTLMNFGSPVDYLAAAFRGDVDAGWFWEANLIRAHEALEPRGWTTLATRADVAPEAAIAGHGPLPISLRAAEEKPEAIAGALRAYQRAADWCQSNLEECARMANRLMGVAVEDALEILPHMHYYVGFPADYVDLMRDMKEFALEQGYLSEDYDFDAKLVTGPIRLAFPDAVEID